MTMPFQREEHGFPQYRSASSGAIQAVVDGTAVDAMLTRADDLRRLLADLEDAVTAREAVEARAKGRDSALLDRFGGRR